MLPVNRGGRCSERPTGPKHRSVNAAGVKRSCPELGLDCEAAVTVMTKNVHSVGPIKEDRLAAQHNWREGRVNFEAKGLLYCRPLQHRREVAVSVELAQNVSEPLAFGEAHQEREGQPRPRDVTRAQCSCLQGTLLRPDKQVSRCPVHERGAAALGRLRRPTSPPT